jgi:acetyltransferase-like isoleucine patch superfamily enzyme
MNFDFASFFYKFKWVIRALFYRSIFASVGRRTYIGSPCFLYGTKNIYIGNNVKIFPGVRLEAHNNAKLFIEDNVGIGQNVHITCSDIDLIISSGTILSANSYITNIAHNYTELDTSVQDQCTTIKQTTIGKNCYIGMGAGINAGSKLGRQCIVGSNSIVIGEFDDFTVVAGVPGKVINCFS